MTDSGDALAPGTRLEEFEIERVLGAGGFGVTYLARDVSLDAWRAVKEYLPRDWGTRQRDGAIGPRTGADAEDYQWGLTRFLDEARILAKFDHPHLVRVYRVFEAWGTAYMVTEYVEGQTLSAALRASGPWSERQVRELLDALTDGLSAVHVAGLLHRDIKPGNVMVRPDGTPVLIDFGSARQAMGRQSRSVTAVLTPGYAPIEQYSPRGNQGPWTDIYALGALSYEALSGQVPDDATERVREDRLRPVDEVVPQRVSAVLAAAIDAALAVDEGARPQGLDAWRELLVGPAGVAPVSARPRGGESFGAAAVAAAATDAVGADVVAERSGRAAAVALAWRRWWLPGAAAVGLVGVALVVALTAPWNGGDSEEMRREAEVPEEIDPAPDPDPEPAPPPEEIDPAPDPDPEPAPPPEEIDPAPDPDPEPAPPPAVLPAAVEEALGLDRAVRQEIQAGLAAAGFDVGVADGRFGAGTRARLREWQAAVGVPATGYLDAATAAALVEAAQVEAERQAEIAAEERRQAAIDAEAQRQAALAAAPEMVVIPAGRFRMGCVSGRDCFDDEQPVHEVSVGSFAMSKYEVTFEEFDRYTAATGRARAGDEGWGRGGRPVVNMLWEEAQAYVSWLSSETGELYRLPSESEWEYAARAGTETAYSWGNEIGRNRANCDGCGSRWDDEQTAPVGSFGANAWGLHDMAGNVWEWVEDCWHENYARAPSDGTAWTSGGNCGRRVLRGGSWILHSAVPPFGLPQQVHHRPSLRQRRVPCGPDAHPVSLHLLTSGVQGAEPPGGICFASGDLL